MEPGVNWWRIYSMPVISMFYGLIVLMYYFDNMQHRLPHINVRYNDEEAVLSIPGGDLLEGSLKSSKMKFVQEFIRKSTGNALF